MELCLLQKDSRSNLKFQIVLELFHFLIATRRLFPDYDPQLLVGFMMHFELCHEICESEADLISIEHSLPAAESSY